MGKAVNDPWVGRGKCTYLRVISHVSFAGRPPDWVGYLVGNSPYGAHLGVVTPLRVMEPHGEAPKNTNGRGLVYPPVEDALREADLEDMTVYIARR